MNKRILQLTCGLAYAVVLGTVSVPAHATFPGANGQITFTRPTFTGPANVFIANSDGSDALQVPLIFPAEDFSVPVWSPDGNTLLISHTFRLDSAGQCCLPFRPATVHPDGSGFKLLEPPNGPFDMDCWAWSPDGTRIFCGFGGDQPGVFSIRASDGGDPVRLTTNPTGGIDLATDVSPDGTRFVFLRFKPGASPEPKPFRTQQVALFIENLDGTGLRQLTPYGLAAPHEVASAHWSPDGRQIISEMTNGRLFVVRPDGTGLSPIHLQTGTGQYFAFEADWSPDGKRIVFCMFINGGEDIYTAKPDGSDLFQVTNTPDFENGPDWGTHPLQ
jgi:Tol biopolymer transport system component